MSKQQLSFQLHVMLNLLCSFCFLHSAEVHDRESIQALLASLKTEQLTKHLHDFPSSPRILKYTPNVKMTNTPVWFKNNWNKNVLKSAKNESCSRGTEGIHPECHTILKQNDKVPSLPTHNLLLYISLTHKYIHTHPVGNNLEKSDMTLKVLYDYFTQKQKV